MPVEFSGIAIKDLNDRCTFHVFFYDEDSLPINADINVDIDDVFTSYTDMLRAYSSTIINPRKAHMGWATNDDGVDFRK